LKGDIPPGQENAAFAIKHYRFSVKSSDRETIGEPLNPGSGLISQSHKNRDVSAENEEQETLWKYQINGEYLLYKTSFSGKKRDPFL